MKPPPKLNRTYNICVIDIGSPKLGNLGWCLIDKTKGNTFTGSNLDNLFPHIISATRRNGLILGLEAPLFVPIRQDLMLATKARKGEERRPWSAGAGAQVLTMNLPIMIYIFKGIKSADAKISFCLNEEKFTAKPKQIMLFEALVSGKDKGLSHIDDAQILANSCSHYAEERILPPSVLEYEDNTEFFNLAAAALLRCNFINDPNTLSLHTPIYKPTDKPL
ncbi:MAG: hypothetical protein OXD32_05580 [Endozoicomonadaceae bacterium]|nr:hypothetical protein [Endozoicomonadaceae bacterium]MCY4329619.1 hypothetical protein [Endozoicomonadaceae bacterium]